MANWGAFADAFQKSFMAVEEHKRAKEERAWMKEQRARERAAWAESDESKARWKELSDPTAIRVSTAPDLAGTPTASTLQEARSKLFDMNAATDQTQAFTGGAALPEDIEKRAAKFDVNIPKQREPAGAGLPVGQQPQPAPSTGMPGTQQPAPAPEMPGALPAGAAPEKMVTVQDPVTRMYHIVPESQTRVRNSTEIATDLAAELIYQQKPEEAYRLLNQAMDYRLKETDFKKKDWVEKFERARIDPAAVAGLTQSLHKEFGIDVTVTPITINDAAGRPTTALQFNKPGTNAPPFFINAKGEMSSTPDPTGFDATVDRLIGMVKGDTAAAMAGTLQRYSALQTIGIQASQEKRDAELHPLNIAAKKSELETGRVTRGYYRAKIAAAQDKAPPSGYKEGQGRQLEDGNYVTVFLPKRPGRPTLIQGPAFGGVPVREDQYGRAEKMAVAARANGLDIDVDATGTPVYVDRKRGVMSSDIMDFVRAKKEPPRPAERGVPPGPRTGEFVSPVTGRISAVPLPLGLPPQQQGLVNSRQQEALNVSRMGGILGQQLRREFQLKYGMSVDEALQQGQ